MWWTPVTATLYLLDEAGELTPCEAVLELYEGDTQVQAVAAALEDGAQDQGLASPLPEGFAVRSVWLDQPVCYVNLSSAIVRELEETEAVPLALQALARSLCSLDTVEEVQFLVDGEYADRYGTAPVRGAVCVYRVKRRAGRPSFLRSSAQQQPHRQRRGGKARQIRDEGGGHRVAGAENAGGAEIDGDGVKGGFRAA